MPQSYAPEFKKKIVRLHMEEGRTYQSITAEYGVSKASISKWCSEFCVHRTVCRNTKRYHLYHRIFHANRYGIGIYPAGY